MASPVTLYLRKYDLHRHFLDQFKLFRGPGGIKGQMQAGIFFDRAIHQGLTEHPHDFQRADVCWEDYYRAFRYADHPNKYLGLEIDMARTRGAKKFGISFDAISSSGTNYKQVISKLDFAVLSVHNYAYSSVTEKVFLDIDNLDEGIECILCAIEGADILRELNPSIRVVLGHPGRYISERGLGNMTLKQAETIVDRLMQKEVYPEINTSSFNDGREGTVVEGKDSLLSVYTRACTSSNRVPIVSAGNDSHVPGRVYTHVDFDTFQIEHLDEVLIWCDLEGIAKAKEEIGSRIKAEKKARKTSSRIMIQPEIKTEEPEDSPDEP
jgi:hypothetical protein